MVAALPLPPVLLAPLQVISTSAVAIGSTCTMYEVRVSQYLGRYSIKVLARDVVKPVTKLSRPCVTIMPTHDPPYASLLVLVRSSTCKSGANQAHPYIATLLICNTHTSQRIALESRCVAALTNSKHQDAALTSYICNSRCCCSSSSCCYDT